MSKSSLVVHKITPEIDVRDVLCTTYQMRNFYAQFRDGFFTVLDVMNYIQHHYAAKLCRDGEQVLDVCCGRGLVLPLLRYMRKGIAGYTGVDIEPRNAIFMDRRVTDGKPIDVSDYYPFPVTFIESNVATMSNELDGPFDVILYMSSIEHMHKDAGERSIGECRKVSRAGTKMLVTCPNTPEGQSGYDTQYAAHVYEWKRSELLEVLSRNGFRVRGEWGLLIGVRDLQAQFERIGMAGHLELLRRYVPSEWLCPVLAPLFPKACKEIAMLATMSDDVDTPDELEIDVDAIVREMLGGPS